ncbi:MULTISPECIES: formylglycine-generating enzyme family protein [unclassified Dolichospermum]|uniref:formylglycine-generating enzyme family protein n=1 Tax=unclassified Dolichospermum TaxID=2622029 RepID=UPI001446B892|nr:MULTISPECIES: formylglycine-generating enzyme family protein [unclassified Dolichospermum]MTJ18840.1 formylglycine-generating enzyme family protein [Dolichospermum sp. UHCC 0299]MTJ40521.1 formylglycine-generating enzyme family protein [Dolichospermum sp. UHCC 0406]
MSEENIRLTVVQLDLFQSSKSTNFIEDELGVEGTKIFVYKIREFVKNAFNKTFENHEIHEYNEIHSLGGDGYRISFKDVDKAYTFVENFRNLVDNYNQQDNKKRLFRIAAATGEVLYDKSQLNIDKIIGHRVLFTVSRMVTAAEPGWLYVDKATYNDFSQDLQNNFILTSIKGKEHDPNLEAYACRMLENAPKSIKSSYFEVATVNANTTNGVKIIRQSKSYQCIEIDNQPTQYFIEKLFEDINLEMVYIPGGKFKMGTDDQEIKKLCKKYQKDFYKREFPQHEVIIEPFFMGKYPITQAQWQAVAENVTIVEKQLDPNPSHFKGANRPVEFVSWEHAVEFCLRLSNYTKREYRLPSEAEWEYACRAGTTTPFHFGETITKDLALANYDGQHEGTKEVGSFKVANNFGLYDMHGNVWEWCQDHFHNTYEGAPANRNVWQDAKDSNDRRMLRGGSWFNPPDNCRSAYRNFNDLTFDHDIIGFRVVCSGAART